MTSRTSVALALAAGGVLVAVGIALALNNPTIDHTDVGTYQCFAPYDTVLLGDRNRVGMHSGGQDIEDRCYTASRDRFTLACVSAGVGAVVATAGAANLLLRRRAG